AAWDGVIVSRGPFRRGVAKLVDALSVGIPADNAVPVDDLELRAAS
ncbi:MAG: hypothetical protein QOI55_1364, partial [Actinomycetota bacterium]|nr:hypothetical protein [Actinomycetota bacterium]